MRPPECVPDECVSCDADEQCRREKNTEPCPADIYCPEFFHFCYPKESEESKESKESDESKESKESEESDESKESKESDERKEPECKRRCPMNQKCALKKRPCRRGRLCAPVESCVPDFSPKCEKKCASGSTCKMMKPDKCKRGERCDRRPSWECVRNEPKKSKPKGGCPQRKALSPRSIPCMFQRMMRTRQCMGDEMCRQGEKCCTNECGRNACVKPSKRVFR